MQDQLIAYFSAIMPLTAEEIAGIRESMCIRTFKKGTVLLKEGQIAKECYFVLKGCVRQYYVVEGEEKTSNFFTENQWVVSVNSFMNKTPANHYFDCTEETTLVIGTEQKENDLYSQFPKFEKLARIALEKGFGEQQAIVATRVTDSPEQRYLQLLTQQPALVQRVPQYQLASYLGIKPESLSRIRKRIALKAKAEQ
ncbi:Crp/Fnr family transcriptional regulator [Emticicia soli]|uniref:Crp/Fnr family transcriptional regulator n=1 Tax=Emticicia soli TaxID=2027878 RepID=A0ABW5J179_9BACT